ncbi:hypothetical protein HYY74_03340 [Candidatus Woesearchaeota archaeon]|nr:hypothetical protein [Candidatus Woesearchaeota archaeon]
MVSGRLDDPEDLIQLYSTLGFTRKGLDCRPIASSTDDLVAAAQRVIRNVVAEHVGRAYANEKA